MRIIRQSSFVATPWKNGGGTTLEVIRVPAVGEAFCWRVSVAQVCGSGPFSDFTGYRRFMVLLRGAGIRLEFDGHGSRDLRDIGEMAEFDGAWRAQCKLHAGPCTDLNFMSQSGMDVQAAVRRLSAPWSAPPSLTHLVFAVAGPVTLSAVGNPAETLEPWDAAVAMAGDRLVVSAPSSSLVFLASLTDN